MFFQNKITEAAIRATLAKMVPPDPLSAHISGVVIAQKQVTLVVETAAGGAKTAGAKAMEALSKTMEKAVLGLKGVDAVRVVFTAAQPPAPQPAPAATHSDKAHAKKAPLETAHLGNIIAVLSDKGGVGKSTVAEHFDCALAGRGLRVGLLDADIYGPSVPRLFGLTEKPATKDRKLVPLQRYGLQIMSMGLMVDEATPVIWRGAMVQTALKQMIQDVAWGQLDVLVLDLPPGTGDAQLTLAQNVKMAGAIIVSTPQDLALIDARKAIAMFRRLEVPILGVVENMSHFICPHCNTSSAIFGHGGARAEAAQIGEPFLGEVPLTMRLRETSDAGTPLTALEPEHPISQLFDAMAAQVWQQLSTALH